MRPGFRAGESRANLPREARTTAGATCGFPARPTRALQSHASPTRFRLWRPGKHPTVLRRSPRQPAEPVQHLIARGPAASETRRESSAERNRTVRRTALMPRPQRAFAASYAALFVEAVHQELRFHWNLLRQIIGSDDVHN